MFLQDLARSDCIVIMGANMAENHPVGFRFVVQAKEQGAKIIHVDPRFTRTSALADRHVPIRAGSDLVFLGALINFVLTERRWFDEFVRRYTNASVIVGDDFRDTEDLAGLFSGYDPASRRYDESTWRFAAPSDAAPPDADAPEQTAEPYDQRVGDASPLSDPTLRHPRCVFQIVRRHFQRYTPEMVEAVCGVPAERFREIAETICANSGAERTTAFAYSVAWTQHTTGTQIIACCAILQLLLGNIGRPGGGIMALRGHATIQGSTDIPTLFNLLPGYLPMPSALERHDTLPSYLAAVTARAGWWHNAPAYMISLLAAWYGDAATPANDFGYDWLPKIGGDYSFQPMLTKMFDGEIRGLFCMGQNPAVGGQNAGLARRGLANLDWLVVRDAFAIETATFWRDSPEVRDGALSPEAIRTEVFLLPAAMGAEKEGSFTNTQRLIQWHDRAVEPPGDARSEAWFIHQLALRLRRLYEGETGPAAEQFAALAWPYAADQRGEPRLDEVLLEINGYRVGDRNPVGGYGELASDGSTACGCWIYSGVMPEPGRNMARNRDADGPAALGWGWSWPANRRTLYNRASARPDGRPWSERKRWVWWDDATERWTGFDVPDFPVDKSPDYLPPAGALGIDAHSGDAPFIMLTDGRGQLFTPNALRDGPLPTHYEAWESPVPNHLYPEQRANPAAIPIEQSDNRYSAPADPAYPHVLTTYRLTEHHTAGGMSRFVPWLAELQPQGFAEIDPELAAAIGAANGGWVVIASPRAEIETRALVTMRLAPLTIAGRTVHQVGLPWHFGWGGIATGAIANDLTALVEDPNSFIHEGKTGVCAIRAGRLVRPTSAEPRDD